MSLLKAKKLDTSKYATPSKYLEDFTAWIDLYIGNTTTEAKEMLLMDLVKNYSYYAVWYTQQIANTLTGAHIISERMKFMNTYIVECFYDLRIPYRNVAEGYSIIDKSVSALLEGATEKEVYLVIEETIKALKGTKDDTTN